MNIKPIVIDCDPGTDDAHALLLALASPLLDVRAVTTVAGNMPLEITSENALKLVELAGRALPVAAGCARPICREPIPPEEIFHGKNGLGNAEIPPAQRGLSPLNAVETLRQCILDCDGLHIVALGPLTNLALLLRLYPELTPRIGGLTIMGGAKGRGNITPYAEFNFFCDPEAADIVLSSGLPITLVDLTGVEDAAVGEADFPLLAGTDGPVSRFLTQTLAFGLQSARRFGEESFVINDSVTVAALLDPDLLQTQRCKARVELRDKDRYGQCLIEPCAEGNVLLSVGVDRARYLALCAQVPQAYGV